MAPGLLREALSHQARFRLLLRHAQWISIFLPRPHYNTAEEPWLKYQSIEENGVVIPESEVEYVTCNWTQKGIEFIQRSLDDEQPFFLYLSTHTLSISRYKSDLKTIKKWFPKATKQRQTYLAMIYAMDRRIGETLELLESRKQLRNTIVVFLSDNGGTAKAPSDNAPTAQPQVVPLQWSQPSSLHHDVEGKIKPGSYDPVVSSLDLLPTFLDAAGLEVAGLGAANAISEFKGEGVSLMPLLKERKAFR